MKYFCFFMLLVSTGYAQDFGKDWQSFLDKQKEQQNYWEMTIQSQSQPVKIQFFKQAQSNYYNYNGQIEVFWDAKNYIMVQHPNKLIVNKKVKKENFLANVYPNADSLLKLVKNIKYKPKEQGRREYVLTFEANTQPQIKEMVYSFYTLGQGVYLEKIVFFSREAKVLPIEMTWKYLDKVSQHYFQRTHYLSKQDQASSNYLGYGIIKE